MSILTGNFNVMKDDFGVYVANIGAYASGILHGSWLKLPATPEEIENCMKEVFTGRFSWDYDREYAIHDYCLPFRISEYEGIDPLNDQIERMQSALDSIGCDKRIISHLSQYEMNLDTIIEAIEEGRVRIYWGCETVADALQELHDECTLFNAPDEVMAYFDWERYARDYQWNFNGFFVERVRDLGTDCVIEFSYR
jgi:antirestriction protein